MSFPSLNSLALAIRMIGGGATPENAIGATYWNVINSENPYVFLHNDYGGEPTFDQSYFDDYAQLDDTAISTKRLSSMVGAAGDGRFSYRLASAPSSNVGSQAGAGYFYNSSGGAGYRNDVAVSATSNVYSFSGDQTIIMPFRYWHIDNTDRMIMGCWVNSTSTLQEWMLGINASNQLYYKWRDSSDNLRTATFTNTEFAPSETNTFDLGTSIYINSADFTYLVLERDTVNGEFRLYLNDELVQTVTNSLLTTDTFRTNATVFTVGGDASNGQLPSSVDLFHLTLFEKTLSDAVKTQLFELFFIGTNPHTLTSRDDYKGNTHTRTQPIADPQTFHDYVMMRGPQFYYDMANHLTDTTMITDAVDRIPGAIGFNGTISLQDSSNKGAALSVYGAPASIQVGDQNGFAAYSEFAGRALGAPIGDRAFTITFSTEDLNTLSANNRTIFRVDTWNVGFTTVLNIILTTTGTFQIENEWLGTSYTLCDLVGGSHPCWSDDDPHLFTIGWWRRSGTSCGTFFLIIDNELVDSADLENDGGQPNTTGAIAFERDNGKVMATFGGNSGDTNWSTYFSDISLCAGGQNIATNMEDIFQMHSMWTSGAKDVHPAAWSFKVAVMNQSRYAVPHYWALNESSGTTANVDFGFFGQTRAALVSVNDLGTFDEASSLASGGQGTAQDIGGVANNVLRATNQLVLTGALVKYAGYLVGRQRAYSFHVHFNIKYTGTLATDCMIMGKHTNGRVLTGDEDDWLIGTDPSDGNDIGLIARSSDPVATTGRLSIIPSASAIGLNDGNWHFVSVRYDNVTGVISTKVDDANETTFNVSSTPVGANPVWGSKNQPFTIGQYSDGIGNVMDAAIHCVGVCQGYVTDTMRTEIYNWFKYDQATPGSSLAVNITDGVILESLPNGLQTTAESQTANASGGVGPYSYSWARVSGGIALSADNPTSSSTAWSGNETDANTNETWQCTVTDSDTPPNVESATCTLNVTWGTPS